MPTQKRPKPLYQRGQYKLYPREGRNLEIVWYDAERKRERSISAGTADVGEGRLALDRRYLDDTSHRLCPTCHRPWDSAGSPLLLTVIGDYLLLSEGKDGFESAKHRLAHVTTYILETNPAITSAAADARWIDGFRKWLLARPVTEGQKVRQRSLSQVEGCVMQLAAAINATPGERAQFKAEQQKAVSNSPTYRADVAKLAEMFDYCLRPDEPTDKLRELRIRERDSLLRYLRMAVATWARPEAIFDVTDKQWFSDARVLDLNPPGRRQTKKHRPRLPIPRQFAPHLDDLKGQWLSISVIWSPWGKMAAAIGLPGDRQSGPKLIRRSMATLARKRIGEANWRQGEMMLGHVRSSVSDIYAIPDPLNLGLALAATESIIDEIEKLAPGAFYRAHTATRVALSVVSGGLGA